MPHVRRHRLSAEERAEFWTRWKRGESCRAIAAALGRGADTFYRVAVRHGGIPPPVRRRAPQTLRLAEREEISRALAEGVSLRTIAQRLGRAPSLAPRSQRTRGRLVGSRTGTSGAVQGNRPTKPPAAVAKVPSK